MHAAERILHGHEQPAVPELSPSTSAGDSSGWLPGREALTTAQPRRVTR